MVEVLEAVADRDAIGQAISAPERNHTKNEAIRCQDAVFLTVDFDNCVKELRANQATFQAPLHVTVSPAGRRIGVPEIRVHDLVVSFDETRATRAAVLAVLAKYGCQERAEDRDASWGGPALSISPPNFLSVITAQMT